MLCVFSQQQQIDRGHVYLEYPESGKSTAVDTQEVLRVKCEFLIFLGKFFFSSTNKWSLGPVVIIIMCSCATPLGTSRRGTLYTGILYICYNCNDQQQYCTWLLLYVVGTQVVITAECFFSCCMIDCVCKYLQTLSSVFISVQMTLFVADRAVLFCAVQQEDGSTTAALCDSRSQQSAARLYLTAVFALQSPTRRAVQTSATFYTIQVHSTIPPFGTAIVRETKQMLSGLLRSPHSLFPPGNHVSEGHLACI